MTEKEVLLARFYKDNFKMKSKNNLYSPIDYCRKRNFGKRGISGWISRLINSPEKEITKECDDIVTDIIVPNENGVAKILHNYSINQTYRKENKYENVIISFHLTFLTFTESSRKIVDEQFMLWPESKQGYLLTLFEELKFQKKSEEYWTATKWCMKYYNLEPIQDSTSVNNPPLTEEIKN
ncbi:uncharacterized protein LOC132936538 isoform X2 [Metopolophium dirhodum]|uniref:uncharacterized protein LOC132936538 isoform X2 n=1 Tax=Metopolophium dirhodum TaxID=44670 RepID=UPI00298F59FC|nr:uncharacterized protein LOC132936538 isoform X2 [Metopolophium dirhodum]